MLKAEGPWHHPARSKKKKNRGNYAELRIGESAGFLKGAGATGRWGGPPPRPARSSLCRRGRKEKGGGDVHLNTEGED